MAAIIFVVLVLAVIWKGLMDTNRQIQTDIIEAAFRKMATELRPLSENHGMVLTTGRDILSVPGFRSNFPIGFLFIQISDPDPRIGDVASLFFLPLNDRCEILCNLWSKPYSHAYYPRDKKIFLGNRSFPMPYAERAIYLVKIHLERMQAAVT